MLSSDSLILHFEIPSFGSVSLETNTKKVRKTPKVTSHLKRGCTKTSKGEGDLPHSTCFPFPVALVDDVDDFPFLIQYYFVIQLIHLTVNLICDESSLILQNVEQVLVPL